MTKANFIVEPGRQEVLMSRVLNAPRKLVFSVYTDPKHIPNWWGPKILKTTVDKMELRPGGLWRFVQLAPDGKEHAFHGVYHEITAPERLVYTFEYEGMPGHVLLDTVTFEEQNGKTKLKIRSVFQTLEDRDGMVSSGMESGATESMERLEELLAKI